MAAGTGGKSLFLGNFIHSKSLDGLEYLHDTAVFVDEKGVIVAIENECDQKKAEETIFPKLGWTAGDISVKVSKAHQFFFPGFIGLSIHQFSRDMLTVFRYAYSCFSVPKCRYLWQIHLAGLAKHLHLPLGKQLEVHPQSYQSVHKLYQKDAFSRHYHGILLRYYFCSIHKPPRRPLPLLRPTSLHRALLHGHPLSRLLPRCLSSSIPRRHQSHNLSHRQNRPLTFSDHAYHHSPFCTQLFQPADAFPRRTAKRNRSTGSNTHL